ncbi:ABC transporter permease [Solemya velum gill symbiont]|uniref:ABC transporter permease n=1 Tax=Solemya velum gill symbiont TaxID=2340 RepID=UPI0009985101|nr:ABC transporter permease [Solemya velum gill symbiont]OOZ48890.1 ABC transporter permease [Solemya velum gill symbiont]
MRLLIAVSFLLCWLLAALFGSSFFGDANHINLELILKAPSLDAPLGYDELGRSVAARLIDGARVALLVSVITVFVSALFGSVVGLVSGYYGGWVDRIVSRIIDIVLAFPGILLAIALAAVLGPGIESLVIAISAVGWVGYARLARAQAMSLRSRDHVTAAIALGSGEGVILFRHVLPLMWIPLMVEASFGLASVIVAEAGLSFLGLGVQPPDASWGSMIREGSRFLLVSPHLAIFPGLAIMAVVLAANLLGDWLRDRLDVKRF